MANTREHRYAVSLIWNGNLGTGTSGYRDYSRDYEIGADGKAAIHGSADPAFRSGTTSRASLSADSGRHHLVSPRRLHRNPQPFGAPENDADC